VRSSRAGSRKAVIRPSTASYTERAGCIGGLARYRMLLC